MRPEITERPDESRLGQVVPLPVASPDVLLPADPHQTESRVRSTLRRVGLHLVNLASDLAGDDIAGRTARRGLIRLAGGSVAPSAHLLGGTRYSRPMNLRVGDRCLINRNCYLDLHGRVTLGDDVVIGNWAITAYAMP